MICVGFGQDSHRFESVATGKTCMLGGVEFEDIVGLEGNSDADPVLHAICNAISSVSGIPILGKVSDEMCLKQGITDSRFYVEAALTTIPNFQINHVAISIECKKPKIMPKLAAMRRSIAQCLSIDITQVGITATSGEGLTDVGSGKGVACSCTITLQKK